MRFTARSLALTSVSALVLVGLTIPAASAATTPTVTSAPNYNAASTTETVSGTALYAGDPIAIQLTNGTSSSTTQNVNANSSGAWSYTFSAADAQAVVDGTVKVTATETYCTGVGSSGYNGKSCPLLQATTTASGSTTYTKDTVIPGAPTITALPGTGSGTDGVINSATPSPITASGSGEAGDTINLTLGSLSASSTVLKSGLWSAQFDPSSLPDGNYTASATQTDALGNVSPAGTKAVVKDTVAPRISTTSPINGATLAPPASVTFVYHDVLAAGSKIDVSNGGTAVGGSVAINAGTATFTPSSAFGSGNYTAIATAYDAYGNSAVTTITFTVDATPPSITNLAATKTTATVSKSTVSGTLSEPASLTVTATDSNGTTASGSLKAPAGNFSLPVDENALASGTITVRVKAVDPYGNVSVTTTTHARVLPPATIVTLTVPTWTAVGWSMTLNGAVHLLHPNGYGTVTLIHTSLGGKLQIVAPAVRVASNGTFAFRYFPTTSGKYYAVYNGDSKNSGVKSPIFSSQIRYAISAASATGSASTAAVIGGAVHNPAIGTVLTILKQNVDGTWTKLGTAKVDRTRHYRFSVKLPKGQSTIRVTVPSSAGYYGNAATIKVLRT